MRWSTEPEQQTKYVQSRLYIWFVCFEKLLLLVAASCCVSTSEKMLLKGFQFVSNRFSK